MLAVVDIGNTRITIGIFDNENLLEIFNISTLKELSEIEYEFKNQNTNIINNPKEWINCRNEILCKNISDKYINYLPIPNYQNNITFQNHQIILQIFQKSQDSFFSNILPKILMIFYRFFLTQVPLKST